MSFSYNELNWYKHVQKVTEDNFVHAPVGLTNNYQWTDFYGEGISGILTEQAEAWYYKSNLGDGQFTWAEKIAPKPSFTGIGNGVLQLQDLEANGKKQIVINSPGIKGFFELETMDNVKWTMERQNVNSPLSIVHCPKDWLPFKNFETMPNVDFRDRT